MMTQSILDHEIYIRLIAFSAVFIAIAVWELIAPRRPLTVSKLVRWYSNLSIVVLNTLLLRFLFPLAAVGVSAYINRMGWGFFNFKTLPNWLEIVLAVVMLDFTIYLQHVMFHAVPTLWRLHRMHHADMDYDVTTGSRFHPLEIILSMIIKLSVITLIGAPVLSVLIFEVLLNGTAMFNHGNIKLPLGLDRVMRWLIVTPDMHRVHHSVVPEETNSNYGFNLPWWDRLMGTYRDQPKAGHLQMTIGLKTFRQAFEQHLLYMLFQPFKRDSNQSN